MRGFITQHICKIRETNINESAQTAGVLRTRQKGGAVVVNNACEGNSAHRESTVRSNNCSAAVIVGAYSSSRQCSAQNDEEQMRALLLFCMKLSKLRIEFVKQALHKAKEIREKIPEHAISLTNDRFNGADKVLRRVVNSRKVRVYVLNES